MSEIVTSLTHNLDSTYTYNIPQQVFREGMFRDGMTYSYYENWNTEASDDNFTFHRLLNRYVSDSNRYVAGYFDDDTLFCYFKEPMYFGVHLAAHNQKNIDNALQWFKEQLPRMEVKERQSIPIEFWYNTQEGPKSNIRNLDVPRWDEVIDNYSSNIRPNLASLMEATEPQGGKLILWSGAPGTGKTWALRALGWEWRKWCSFHYLTEPEAFFGRQIAGLMQVILKEDKDKWKLLVLEDTGEMMVADAKQRVGQNLSRLLNIMDGLLGQGLKVMALVTTNEEMGTLHPAILRPGRCWTHINFDQLSKEEAKKWLVSHGEKMTAIDEPQYLADLYGRLNNWTKKSENKQKVGFI